MKKNNRFICICIFMAVSVFGGQDIDFQLQTVGGEEKPGSNILSAWGSLLQLNYYNAIRLNKQWRINANAKFDGIVDGITSASNKFSPLRQINYPFTIIPTLGFTYDGPFSVHAMVDESVLPKSKAVDFPVDKTTISPQLKATMTLRSRTNGELSVDVPVNRFRGQADGLLTSLLYDYDSLDFERNGEWDSDLWGSMLLGVSFLDEKLWIKAGGLFKHDLNDHTGYNVANGFGGLEANVSLLKRKLYGTANLYLRYILSDIMSHADQADELGLQSHIRLFYQLVPRKFIKTDIEFETAPVDDELWYLKQRYELAYRNVFKNSSYFEIGGWLSHGSLVPRVCGYAQGSIALGKHCELAPGLKAYMLSEGVGNWESQGTVDKSQVPNYDSTINIVTVMEDNVLKKYIFELDNAWHKYEYITKYSFAFYRTDLEMVFNYKVGAERVAVFKNCIVSCGVRYKFFTWNSNLLDPKYTTTMHILLGISTYL